MLRKATWICLCASVALAAQDNPDLLEANAVTLMSRHQYEEAQKLLETAVSMRQKPSGPQSIEYGLDLLRLGEIARSLHRFPDADGWDMRAAAALGTRPEASRALMNLGVSALSKQNYSAAADYFQRAPRLDPTLAGAATMWLAIVRQREKNDPEADSLFQNAIAVQDQSTPDAATTMELYAQFLREQGRAAEATAFSDRAAAIRKGRTAHFGPPPQPNAAIYRVGGGVTPPSLISKIEPEFSEVARVAKYQGTVLLYVEVGPDGSVQNVRVLRPLGLGLDEKAIEAVSQWRFNPGKKDGAPVTVVANIEVNFRLL